MIRRFAALGAVAGLLASAQAAEALVVENVSGPFNQVVLVLAYDCTRSDGSTPDGTRTTSIKCRGLPGPVSTRCDYEDEMRSDSGYSTNACAVEAQGVEVSCTSAGSHSVEPRFSERADGCAVTRDEARIACRETHQYEPFRKDALACETRPVLEDEVGVDTPFGHTDEYLALLDGQPRLP